MATHRERVSKTQPSQGVTPTDVLVAAGLYTKGASGLKPTAKLEEWKNRSERTPLENHLWLQDLEHLATLVLATRTAKASGMPVDFSGSTQNLSARIARLMTSPEEWRAGTEETAPTNASTMLMIDLGNAADKALGISPGRGR